MPIHGIRLSVRNWLAILDTNPSTGRRSLKAVPREHSTWLVSPLFRDETAALDNSINFSFSCFRFAEDFFIELGCSHVLGHGGIWLCEVGTKYSPLQLLTKPASLSGVDSSPCRHLPLLPLHRQQADSSLQKEHVGWGRWGEEDPFSPSFDSISEATWVSVFPVSPKSPSHCVVL